jgi:hypothetical protein
VIHVPVRDQHNLHLRRVKAELLEPRKELLTSTTTMSRRFRHPGM